MALKMILPQALLLLLLAFAAQAQTIQVVSEDAFAPYAYVEDGVLKGIGVDVARAVLHALGREETIQVFPWPRAYAMASTQPNTMIPCIGRNAERDRLFAWVGPVAPKEEYLFALAGRQEIVLDTLDDARKYAIGTVPNDQREQYLVSKGFESGRQLDPTSTYSQGYLKLKARRIDLWSMNELTAYHTVRKLGDDPAITLRKALHLTDLTGELYMAFNKDTPEAVVQAFREALEKIKAEGTYQRILDSYLK